MKNNILICGVGGQGTVLASRLIAASYLAKDKFVRTAETIGMAQRGGCVVSHVRIDSSDKSSIIPMHTADLLIAFEPAEAVRCLPRLSDDCASVINSRTVMPVTASLGGTAYNEEEIFNILSSRRNIILIDANKLAAEAGSAKAVNIVLIGAAIGAGYLDFSKEEITEALKKMLPPKVHAINLKALELGIKAVKQ